MDLPRKRLREAPQTGRFQFGLTSLLLFVTLAAILCSVVAMNPGLGIVAAILTIPALVRTCVVAWRGEQYGDPVSPVAKVAVFLLTMVVGGVVLVPAGIAFFFVACMTSGWPIGELNNRAMIMGGIAGTIVAVPRPVFRSHHTWHSRRLTTWRLTQK